LEPLETTCLMETFVINPLFMTWYSVREVSHFPLECMEF
jgi:hypothetical protein